MKIAGVRSPRVRARSTAGDRDNLDSKIEDIEKKIDEAQMENDSEKANKLYQEQQELYARLGNAPIVGADGRAV